MVAGPRQGIGELQVEHARLDQGQGVAEPDLQDLVHPREHDHHAVGRRRATAGQPGAGPAGDDRATVFRADSHDLGHLFRGARKDHGQGHAALDGEGVAIVDDQLRRRREDVLGPQCRAKLADQVGIGHVVG